MSASGTTRTFRNVRYSVAVGCKADIEQAASKMLEQRGCCSQYTALSPSSRGNASGAAGQSCVRPRYLGSARWLRRSYTLARSTAAEPVGW